MSVFLVCLNSVLPIFILLLVGYVSRLAKLTDDDSVQKLNKIAYDVFLPVMLFQNIYSSDLSSAIRPKLIVYSIACVFILYFACILFVTHFFHERSKQGVIIQGIYRSNIVIVGMPVAEALSKSADISSVAVIIGIIVPLYNVLAVICLEVFRGQKVDIRHIIKQIIKNPLIIGSLSGILFLIFKLRLPSPIETVIDDMAAVGSPLMLFLLGAFFHFESIVSHWKELLVVCLGRLVIVPAVFLSLAFLLGFRGVEFIALVTLFASSTAASSFTMAQQMNADSVLAGDIVILTSALCSFTLYFWGVLFSAIGAF